VARPKLRKDGVDFPKLYNSPKVSSPGTVAGTNFDVGDDVEIRSKTSNKVWQGKVDSKVGGDVYNATVTRKVPPRAQEDEDEGHKGTEDIDVTVTNTSGSDTVPKQTQVVPPP